MCVKREREIKKNYFVLLFFTFFHSPSPFLRLSPSLSLPRAGREPPPPLVSFETNSKPDPIPEHAPDPPEDPPAPPGLRHLARHTAAAEAVCRRDARLEEGQLGEPLGGLAHPDGDAGHGGVGPLFVFGVVLSFMVVVGVEEEDGF